MLRPPAAELMMMTIFLRHDETKTLDEIDADLAKTGFQKSFPPPGIEVVSWYVMMGSGEVNLALSARQASRREPLNTALGVRSGRSFIRPTTIARCGRHQKNRGGEGQKRNVNSDCFSRGNYAVTRQSRESQTFLVPGQEETKPCGNS